MPRKRFHHLTELERQAYVGFAARYRMIDLEAAAAKSAVEADERRFVEALAARLGLEASSIGGRYTVNANTWTLEPAPEATAHGQ
jgi:hypothetical protein